LDCPLLDDLNGLEFETGMLQVLSPPGLPLSMDWSLVRALHFSFPNLIYLKDILPDSDSTVIFKNTPVPVHCVVADRLSGGKVPTRELLVHDYENSAWIKDKFVPQSYIDEFYEKLNQDYED
jgi:hypothetical protein